VADEAPQAPPSEPRRGGRPRRSPRGPVVTRRQRPRATPRNPVPTGPSPSSWTPRLLALARYASPIQLVLQELINNLLRQSKRAGDIERTSIDVGLWRIIHPDSHVRGRPRRKPAPAVRTAPNPLTRPDARPKPTAKPAPKPAPEPLNLPRILTPPRPAPGARPRPAPRPAPKPAPNPGFPLLKSPPRIYFRPPPPITDIPLLTRFKAPGVKSPLSMPGTRPGVGTLQLPRFDPLAQPRAEPDRKRCRCPKPKKAKPGRGFFRVTASGQVKRKYWKTGKHHTREYRDASNAG